MRCAEGGTAGFTFTAQCAHATLSCVPERRHRRPARDVDRYTFLANRTKSTAFLCSTLRGLSQASMIILPASLAAFAATARYSCDDIVPEYSLTYDRAMPSIRALVLGVRLMFDCSLHGKGM